MTPQNQTDWIAKAAHALGVPLVRHTATKATGPCPHCHAGTDRLVVFEDGGYWCNQCHKTGWWHPVQNGAEVVAQARAERAERQGVLLARMAHCSDWQAYHHAVLDGPELELWLNEGMSFDDVVAWGLGWCAACPLEPQYASLTIPTFYKQRLVDIRHRLIGAEQGNKYRSHLAGLMPSVFNADALHAAETVVVVEGEKKTIASVRAGFPASMGLPGAHFGEQLLEVLAELDLRQRVILALDPDQVANAERLALQIGDSHVAMVADFPLKPDDFLARYGPQAYAAVLKQARPVRSAHARSRS